jgi:hypothetical protein
MTSLFCGYGDNVGILLRNLQDEPVDLISLDSPFNSVKNYNAFLGEKDAPSGQPDSRVDVADCLRLSSTCHGPNVEPLVRPA